MLFRTSSDTNKLAANSEPDPNPDHSVRRVPQPTRCARYLRQHASNLDTGKTSKHNPK